MKPNLLNFFKSNSDQLVPRSIEKIVVNRLLVLIITFFVITSMIFLSVSVYREVATFDYEVKIYLANITDLISNQIKSVNVRVSNLVNMISASVYGGAEFNDLKTSKLLYSQVNNPDAEMFCIAVKIGNNEPVIVFRDSGHENQALRKSASELTKAIVSSPNWNSFATGRFVVKLVYGTPYFLVTQESNNLSNRIKVALLINASLFVDPLIQAAQTMRQLDVVTNFEISSVNQSILKFGKPINDILSVEFEKVLPDMFLAGQDVTISIVAKKANLVLKILASLLFWVVAALLLLIVIRLKVGLVLKEHVRPIVDLRKDLDGISQIVTLKNSGSNLQQEYNKISSLKERVTGIIEIDQMAASFFVLVDRLRQTELENSVLSRSAVFVEIAAQVSHDMRSPLAALNMIIGQLQNLPESQRLILRNSINRINDIAHDLLFKAKEHKSQQSSSNAIAAGGESPFIKLQVELLPALIDAIVSEKRMQFRDKMGVEIEAELQDSYGAFANINATEFARVVSNIANNSLEAMPHGKGKFVLSVKRDKGFVTVIAKDNGSGIPAHILEKLGQMGVTHGKEGTQSGSGLGVYHAKKTVESFGGSFVVESKEGIGTTITMTFPASPAPEWFVEALNLGPDSQVISLDDDLSIHSVWQGRFQSLNIAAHRIEHLTFTSGPEFKRFLQATSNVPSNRLYLVDYELLNQKQTGLDMIEELGLGSQSILVTSRYEEGPIRERCAKLGVKLIPKGVAGFVPLIIAKPKQRFHAVLLDDDSLVEMTWQMAAAEQNKTLLYFNNPSDFFKQSVDIDPNSPLFVDSNLGNGIKGENVAKQAFDMGFKNIYLCTGYDPGDFPSMPWIIKVVGKEPYFP